LAYKNALSAYKETRVTTAGQGQLIVMLYDELARYLDEALHTLEMGEPVKTLPSNIERFGRSVVKAQEIISELMVSLDFDRGGEIAKNLFSLYTWFNRELIEANISHDAHRISNVRNFTYELKGAWLEIVNAGAAEIVDREAVGVSIAG